MSDDEDNEEIEDDPILMDSLTEDFEMPDTFENVRNRIMHSSRIREPDTKFLKKMRAIDYTGQPKTSLDQYVHIKLSKRKRSSAATEEVNDQEYNECSNCAVPFVFLEHEAIKTCPSCGLSHFHQEYSLKDIAFDGYVTTPSYLYKRSNHFKTWIMRIQAKESTIVNREIVETVRNELRKERITDYTTLKHTKVREILKKLRMNKYYNHCMQITSIISGKEPPKMTQEQEDTLLQMFDHIQEPFQKIIAKEPRQNMLSYSFLIHKFLQIMGWDDLVSYFPFLISSDKMFYQDAIWKKICAEAGFEYHKSSM